MLNVVEVDVRNIAGPARHATVCAHFDKLREYQELHILSDHDPLPIFSQLEVRVNGKIGWTYLEEGPDTWRVRVRKPSLVQLNSAEESSCCSDGACGG